MIRQFLSRQLAIGNVFPRVAVCFLAVLLLSSISGAQQGTANRDESIDARRQLMIIDSVTATLDSFYVFPAKAKEMDKLAHDQYRKGAYKSITSAAAFAEKLSTDLFAVCKDKHFGIRYLPPQSRPALQQDSLAQKRNEEAELARLRRENFYFQRLERLDGNVGYLDFRQFVDASLAGATAVAAMNFLSNCDAIIFDLRENGGGEPSMIQLLLSYFFAEPKHINSFYVRSRDAIDQFWTQAYVPGKKMLDIPLYVLTSNYTFSGAEEFTYNLKNMKRATIVGETTGGGAHPVAEHYFPTLAIEMRVPYGRAINPITGTNWEGVGVAPDIAVPQEKALTTAHMEALKTLRKGITDEQRGFQLDWAIVGLAAELEPVTVDIALLQKYTGKYGPRTITLENGNLYYQREGRPKFKMVPLTQETFALEQLSSFRLKFVMTSSGPASEVVGTYEDGHSDISPRTAD
jgi:retinol-binding protein 3